MNVERRCAPTELRAVSGSGGETRIIGHAAVFEVLSEPLGGFRERISRRAFDGRLDTDVRALVNHDPNRILGRTKSGTLTLQVDHRGLRYDVRLPKTNYAADLAESIRRGDISQSSFAFRALRDEWSKEDGEDVRTVAEAELIDVSPVTFPAYTQTDTTVAQRSYQFHKRLGPYSDKMTYYREKLRRIEAEQARMERGY